MLASWPAGAGLQVRSAESMDTKVRKKVLAVLASWSRQFRDVQVALVFRESLALRRLCSKL
jgi:hypothetical protein